MDFQRKIIVALSGLIMAAGLVTSLTSGNYEFLYYGVSLIAIGLGIVWLDLKVRLPIMVLWGLFVWLILHLAGGMIKVPESAVDTGMTNYTLYNVRLHPWLPRYDQFVHAFGFFVSSLAAWRGLFIGSGMHMRPTFGPRVGAGLIGMGCGGVNEVIEFIATRIMPHTNVGGFENTGWDLVSNMVGCIIAMLTIRFFHERWFAGPAPAKKNPA
ncbi:MAG TPA: hypothetical protein VHN77_09710 [Phycisphaerales bacterium]|nr:hypothetical protein [Phycisphaerales bacterium]